MVEVMERRNLSAGLEIRTDSSGESSKRQIVGHAAVFNQLSVDLGGWYERMNPGTFTSTIERDDIRALWNHDTNWILGRNVAHTLRLEEDAHGLAIANDPPDTQWARDLMVSIRRGDVTQMSIGFWTLRDEWSIEGDIVIRDVFEVKLFDVSPVTAAAYVQTKVDVRMDEMADLSRRLQTGRANAAEVSRLNEMLAKLNKRGSQVATAGDARGQAGLDMRLRILKLVE